MAGGGEGDEKNKHFPEDQEFERKGLTWILPALRNNNEFERSLGSNIGPFPKVPKDRKGGIQIYESE